MHPHRALEVCSPLTTENNILKDHGWKNFKVASRLKFYFQRPVHSAECVWVSNQAENHYYLHLYDSY
jgi:hypothetical protein